MKSTIAIFVLRLFYLILKPQLVSFDLGTVNKIQELKGQTKDDRLIELYDDCADSFL